MEKRRGRGEGKIGKNVEAKGKGKGESGRRGTRIRDKEKKGEEGK